MSTTVKVNVSVLVECKSTWADGCSIAQVKKQAKEEAVEIIRTALENSTAIKGVTSKEVQLTITF